MPDASLFESTLQESVNLETSGELLTAIEKARLALHLAEELQIQESNSKGACQIGVALNVPWAVW